jgi:hypothetical protein
MAAPPFAVFEGWEASASPRLCRAAYDEELVASERADWHGKASASEAAEKLAVWQEREGHGFSRAAKRVTDCGFSR